MAEHILVPVDDSEMSCDALDYAIAECEDAEITALHVIDQSEIHTPIGIEAPTVDRDDIVETYRQKARVVLEDAEETADDHGVEIETEMVEGDVTKSILAYVADNDVDHIVIGSHGRTGAGRILLGSVAESVTRRSSVPVTVVR